MPIFLSIIASPWARLRSHQNRTPWESRWSPTAPIVTTKNGQVFANSRDVAEFFGKAHRSVLMAVDDLMKSMPIEGLHNFMQTPYTNAQNGQTYRAFDMTRDGFTLLAMGFTGRQAAHFKEAYIQRFNEMEEELRSAFPF